MALEVEVAPAEGQALLMTQGGPGEAPGYNAIDLRRMFGAGSGLRPGIFDEAAWAVTPAGDPAMGVEVAANLGVARVDGASVAHQGPYIVAPHSEPAVLEVPAAHASSPRVDLVALQVRDNAHDASGANDARVLYLPGSAVWGASLTNLHGQRALPANAIRLADVLVPALAVAVAAGQIADRRELATLPPDSGAIGAAGRPISDVLPAGAVDGQEVLFQSDTMALDGVVWRLRYRAGSVSPFKWEFVGGSAWLKVTEAPGVGTPQIPTHGPGMITPLAGEYEVTIGARFPATGTAASAAVSGYGYAGQYFSSALPRVRNNGPATSTRDGTRNRTLPQNFDCAMFTATYGVACRWVALRPVKVG